MSNARFGDSSKIKPFNHWGIYYTILSKVDVFIVNYLVVRPQRVFFAYYFRQAIFLLHAEHEKI